MAVSGEIFILSGHKVEVSGRDCYIIRTLLYDGYYMTVPGGFLHYPDIIWRGLGELGHYPGIRRATMVSGGI